jgi:hypothetical protein
MAADAAETVAEASPPQPRRGRWLVVIIVAGLAAVYLGAIASTHAALSGGLAGWSEVVPGNSIGLASITPAEQAQIGPTPGFGQVLWAIRPGGEVSFGFQVHNGGPVPVTVLGLGLRTSDPGVANALAPAGAQLGPGRAR